MERKERKEGYYAVKRKPPYNSSSELAYWDGRIWLKGKFNETATDSDFSYISPVTDTDGAGECNTNK